MQGSNANVSLADKYMRNSGRGGPSEYDGVFAMWYGKGPGVDRCGDVFKHINPAGNASRRRMTPRK